MSYANPDKQKHYLQEYAQKKRGTLKDRHLEYWRSLTDSQLSQLTTREGQIMSLYYGEGTSKQAIAESEQISINTINWHIYNALKKLNSNHR